MFFNIFQFTDDIPEDIKQDPQKLIAFSEAQRNKTNSKGGLRDDSDASAVFGATREDMDTIQPKGNTVSLSDELKKHGGKLNMEQMMRLAGQDV